MPSNREIEYLTFSYNYSHNNLNNYYKSLTARYILIIGRHIAISDCFNCIAYNIHSINADYKYNMYISCLRCCAEQKRFTECKPGCCAVCHFSCAHPNAQRSTSSN